MTTWENNSFKVDIPDTQALEEADICFEWLKLMGTWTQYLLQYCIHNIMKHSERTYIHLLILRPLLMDFASAFSFISLLLFPSIGPAIVLYSVFWVFTKELRWSFMYMQSIYYVYKMQCIIKQRGQTWLIKKQHTAAYPIIFIDFLVYQNALLYIKPIHAQSCSSTGKFCTTSTVPEYSTLFKTNKSNTLYFQTTVHIKNCLNSIVKTPSLATLSSLRADYFLLCANSVFFPPPSCPSYQIL